jgi:hypothetical protein
MKLINLTIVDGPCSFWRMTTCRLVKPAVVFILLATLGTQSPAQQTPSPEGVIRINVNLVQVDAIVTDAKGKPVTNLTADDFVVLQDGIAQAITNFTFIEVKECDVPFRCARPEVYPRQ